MSRPYLAAVGCLGVPVKIVDIYERLAESLRCRFDNGRIFVREPVVASWRRIEVAIPGVVCMTEDHQVGKPSLQSGRETEGLRGVCVDGDTIGTLRPEMCGVPQLRLVPADDLLRFCEVALQDLQGLHDGSIARYSFRPSEFRAWLSKAGGSVAKT